MPKQRTRKSKAPKAVPVKDKINKQQLKQFGNVVPMLNLNVGQQTVNTAGKVQKVARPKL